MELQENLQESGSHNISQTEVNSAHAEGKEHETNVGNMIFHHIMNSDEIEITPLGTIHLPYIFSRPSSPRQEER